MKSCVDLPLWGPYCIGDLTIQLGNYSLNLLHPGVIVTLLLGSAVAVYIFRDPT